LSGHAQQYAEQTGSRSRRNSALFFSMLFLAAILVLSLLQNSNIILVVLLYLCIILGGVSISTLVVTSRHGGSESGLSQSLEDQQSAPKGMDIVSNMNVYVTFASRGSEHSRRELAFIIRNCLEDSKSWKPAEFASDPQFRADMERVVLRYTNSNWKERFGKKESRSERDAYLSSLERIVQRLRAT
jgi:hypothetical protein